MSVIFDTLYKDAPRVPLVISTRRVAVMDAAFPRPALLATHRPGQKRHSSLVEQLRKLTAWV